MDNNDALKILLAPNVERLKLVWKEIDVTQFDSGYCLIVLAVDDRLMKLDTYVGSSSSYS